MRTTRAEWAKRVERWKDSGLTANEFANKLGCNARTLVFWKWQLGKQAPGRPAASSAKRRARGAALLSLIEVSAAPSSSFELQLGSARRLIIPASFEPDALRRLLAVLENPA